MASKRRPTSDLNHDNWDKEEEAEEAGTFTKAKPEVLKDRVIKKAKRKGIQQDGSGSSIFAGFSGFKSAPVAATASFDFLAKDAKKEEPETKVGQSPTKDDPVVEGSKTAAASESKKKLAKSESQKSDEDESSSGSPTKTAATPSQDAKLETEDKKPSLMDLFKPKPGSWECSSCLVTNTEDKTECLACTTPKPSLEKKWECPTCMVFNEAAKLKCVCCETNKPGSTSTEQPKSTSGPVFAPGFKFGSDTSGSGFNFGFKPDLSQASTTGSGFKFGVTSTTPNPGSATGFKFGGGFKFGSTPDDTPTKDSKENLPLDFMEELKTLNSEVFNRMKLQLEQNSCIYLSPIFRDYDRHLTELKSKHKVSETSESGAQMEASGFKFPSNGSSSNDVTHTKPFGTSLSPFGSSGMKTGLTFGSSGAKTGFVFGSSETKTGSIFAFGSGDKNAAGLSLGFADKKPTFTFGTSSFGNAKSSEADGDEDDVPPKVEVASVVEEGAIHSVKCKLFYKKGNEFVDKGLGTLHLKPVEKTEKTQLLIRAQTSLGNILLNVILNKQMSVLKRSNNIQFICVPNPAIPGIENGPVTMLVKVKTAEMADLLETKILERLEN